MLPPTAPPDRISRFADSLLLGFYRALPEGYSVRYSRIDEAAAQLRVRLDLPGGRYETRADILFGKNEKVRIRFMNSLQSVPPKELPGSTSADEVVRIVSHELLKQKQKRKKRSK